MNQRRSGMGLWILVLGLLLISVFAGEGLRLFGAENYTYSEFVQDFDDQKNTIEKVIISPNKEVPTGLITVEYTDGDEKSFHVTDIEDVKVGDEVYIWDNNLITIDDIAEKCNTINYEILSTISDRVPRIIK